MKYRSSHGRCFVKVLLEISHNSQENTCVRVSFLIKLQAEATNFIKNEALAQMFPCEFSKISKNTFFIEHLCILIVLSQMLQSWLGAFSCYLICSIIELFDYTIIKQRKRFLERKDMTISFLTFFSKTF